MSLSLVVDQPEGLQESGPKVLVEQDHCHAGPSPGRWGVAWRIRNLGQQPLQLLAAWLPHSQFRRAEQKLSPKLELPPNGSFQLELPIRCSEPPGAVVENAFLILRVLWRDQEWRVLTRLNVVVDENGTPESTTEAITTQRTGFSRSAPGER